MPSIIHLVRYLSGKFTERHLIIALLTLIVMAVSWKLMTLTMLYEYLYARTHHTEPH